MRFSFLCVIVGLIQAVSHMGDLEKSAVHLAQGNLKVLQRLKWERLEGGEQRWVFVSNLQR